MQSEAKASFYHVTYHSLAGGMKMNSEIYHCHPLFTLALATLPIQLCKIAVATALHRCCSTAKTDVLSIRRHPKMQIANNEGKTELVHHVPLRILTRNGILKAMVDFVASSLAWYAGVQGIPRLGVFPTTHRRRLI